MLTAQPRALRALERLIDEARAHTLLLSGPRGCGPVAGAMLVAHRVLNPTGDAGTQQRIERHVHPDLHWVAPEGSNLQIDPLRAVVEVVSRMPFEAPAQVVVLESADSMSGDNAAAGNSLLKALEEPNGRVVFVLLAERSARVLPTIRSRSIEVVFPPISDARMIETLQLDGIEEPRLLAATGMDLPTLARAARGDLDRARALAAGDAAAARRAELLPLMHAIATGGTAPSGLAARVMARANAASDAEAAAATAEFAAMVELMDAPAQRRFQAKSNPDGAEKRTARRARRARISELHACLAELAAWWRDVLAIHAGAPEVASNRDRITQLTAVAEGSAGPGALAAIDAIDEASARLLFNNADEGVTVGALAAELAALAAGRTTARRLLGAPARTATGYDLQLG